MWFDTISLYLTPPRCVMRTYRADFDGVDFQRVATVAHGIRVAEDLVDACALPVLLIRVPRHAVGHNQVAGIVSLTRHLSRNRGSRHN